MIITKPKTIQIEYDLFLNMASYVVRHYDSEDSDVESIIMGIQKKFKSMARRDLYTDYKSAHSVAAREAARQEYLEMMGVPESFRWSAEQDLNVHPTHLS